MTTIWWHYFYMITSIYHEYQFCHYYAYTLISQNCTFIAKNNTLINCMGII